MNRALLATLMLATAISGCRPINVMMVDPAGPPEYKLGWEDGCDTGLSAEGDFMYKFTYGFKKRPEMAASDQYKNGWNEGFTYCRFALAASKSDDVWDLGGGNIHANERLPW